MLKKIIQLIALLVCAFCEAQDLTTNYAANQFPMCENKDSYWAFQSGKDSVNPPVMGSETTMIQANQFIGQNKNTQIAVGDVQAYRGNQTILADWLIYNPQTTHLTAGDKIVMTRQYDVVSGEWVDYYLDLNKGSFKKAQVYYAKDKMTAKGDLITMYSKKEYNIKNGFFTTCDINDPAWYLKSQEMNFDYQNSQGNARNAIVYFESVPIFYSPYAQFPLGERKSGFLTPNIFSNSNAGMGFGIPYYWNMAPNYDMTIEPKYYANEGIMLTDSFRYINESGSGNIYTEQLPNSSQTNNYRYYWSLNDNHTIFPDVQVGYTYNLVSDNNYFNDFGNFNTVTNNVNLDQSAYISYKPSWGLLSTKVQNYQTLQPIGQPPTSQIYQMLPQINFNLNPADIGAGFKGNFISQFTNFASTTMQNGERTIFYPSVSYPLSNVWGFVTPKFGYNYSMYQLTTAPGTTGTAATIDRSLPITSIDSGLTFVRPLSLGNNSYSQTLEPRLYYLYIPQTYQGDIPIFDTAQATYNLNQLFSENRFSGFDRINMANDITMGATTRLLNDGNGKEIMNFGVGYRYFITPENNTSYGPYGQFPQLNLPQPNLIAELTNNWSSTIKTSASFQYSTVYDTIDAYYAQLNWTPDDYKVFNFRFGYQYQMPLLFYSWTPGQPFVPTSYENQYALDVSGQWPIYANRWFIVGRANYDFTQQQLLNLVGGIQYNGGCWSIQGVYEQYVTNITQITSQVFIQFSLKGLGDIGSGDPTNDLKVNIPGFMPTTASQLN